MNKNTAWGSMKITVPTTMTYTSKTGSKSHRSPLTATGKIANKDGVPAIKLVTQEHADKERKLVRSVLRHKPPDYSHLVKIPNDVEELQALVNQRKQKPRTEAEIYVEKLKAKIEENHMEIFWIDTTNNQMLGKKTLEQIEQMIMSDVKRYAGKHMVNVNLILRPRLDFDRLKPDDTLFTIWIEVYEVSEHGRINTSIADVWLLALHYTKDELMANKFSIQGLREMVKHVVSKKIVTDPGGMSISQYNRKLKRLTK
jgi:hypothetical protein